MVPPIKNRGKVDGDKGGNSVHHVLLILEALCCAHTDLNILKFGNGIYKNNFFVNYFVRWKSNKFISISNLTKKVLHTLENFPYEYYLQNILFYFIFGLFYLFDCTVVLTTNFNIRYSLKKI